MGQGFWTIERVELLIRLVRSGENLSCRELAGRIGDGCTRNAIIGKLGHMGIATPKVRGNSRLRQGFVAPAAPPPEPKRPKPVRIVRVA